MSKMKFKSGFTMIELMVSLAITLIVVAGVYEVYIQMKKTHESQQIKVELQQAARNTLDTMSREISNAGYLGKMIKVSAVGPMIEFTEYLPSAGAIRRIRYRFDSNANVIYRGEIADGNTLYDGNEYVIADHVTGLAFDYYKDYTPTGQIYPEDDPTHTDPSEHVQILTAPSISTNVRRITVQITMTSSKKDPVTNDYKSIVLKADLAPTNLAEGQQNSQPIDAPAHVYAVDPGDCQSLEVKWDAVKDPGLAGYLVKWGTASKVYDAGDEVVPLSQLSDKNNPDVMLTGFQITKYSDRVNNINTKYYIVVYSVNSSGVASDTPSPEISGPSDATKDYRSFPASDNDTILNPLKPSPPPSGATYNRGSTNTYNGQALTANQIMLTWTPAIQPTVQPPHVATVGYRLYRSEVPFTDLNVFPIPESYKIADEMVLGPTVGSYLDTVPINCKNYYYAICSVNCDDSLIHGLPYTQSDYYQFSAAKSATSSTVPAALTPSLSSTGGYRRVFVNLTNPLTTVGDPASDPDFDSTYVYVSTTGIPTINQTTGAVATDGGATCEGVFNSSGGGGQGIFMQPGAGGDNNFVFNNWTQYEPSNGTPSLPNTQTYYFRAVAFDKCGKFASATGTSTTQTTLCGDDPAGAPSPAPSNLTADGCGDTITLNWTGVPSSVTDLAGYRVYRSLSNNFVGNMDPITGALGGSSCISGSGPIWATTFPDSSAVDGEAYYYGVSATDCIWENITNPPPPNYPDYNTTKANNITAPITIGPIYPGRLLLYQAPIMNKPPSGTDLYNLVTVSGINPADNSSTAFHNAVTFYIQNTSAGSVTLNHINLSWSHQAAYLKKILIGGLPGAPSINYSYSTSPLPESTASANGVAITGVDFKDTQSWATGANLYSQAIPVTLVFTNSDGSASSATNMNSDTIGVTLTYENDSTKKTDCMQNLTVNVPAGPTLYGSTINIPDYGSKAFNATSSINPNTTVHPVGVGGRNTDVHALVTVSGQYNTFNNGSTVTTQNYNISSANVYVATTPIGTTYPTGYTFYPVTDTQIGGSINFTNNFIDAIIPPQNTITAGMRVWYYFTVQSEDGNTYRLPAADSGYFMYDQNEWDPCLYTPQPPGSLNYTVSGGLVTLTWVPPTRYTDGNTILSPDQLSYKIYRKKGINGTYSLYATTSAGATSYTDTDGTVFNSTTAYFYEITAINLCPNESTLSNQVVVTTPNTPPTFTVNRTSNTSPTATLNWTAPTLNTDGSTLTDLNAFYIYLNGVQVDSVSSSTTSYQFTTLTPGNSYTFGIAAVNAHGITSAITSVSH